MSYMHTCECNLLCGSRLEPRDQRDYIGPASAPVSGVRRTPPESSKRTAGLPGRRGLIGPVSHARACLMFAVVLVSLAATACAPAEPAAATPPQSSPLEFIGQWGAHGEGPGELAQPVGLAVDLNARVYLADRRSGRLQKFEATGVPLLSYQDAAVRSASALAVDSGGAIYIADAHQGRVWIRFPEGDLLRNFRVTPQRTPDPSFGFCVTEDGTVVVPDPDGGRVQTFTSNGRVEAVWKLPPVPSGQPARPVAAAAGLDEFVYVVDATGRILKYTTRGAQMASWDAPADFEAPVRGLAVSRTHLFVLRGAKPQLDVWTLNGQRVLMDTFGDRFDYAPPPSLYLGVSRDEQVFLLDPDPAAPRVLRFRLRLTAP
jgi:hypothetical protein